MSDTERPDNATGDSVTSARVHVFLYSLLTFLGFNALEQGETISSILDTLEAWLDDAKSIRRDHQGATARIWWDAFKAAWNGGEKTIDHAERQANAATSAFGRQFLPIAEEDERDTLNTADFDAMRSELDLADRYRGEICDAIDGRNGARAFEHARVIDGLRVERDAYANELAACRIQLDERAAQRDRLMRDVRGALVPLAKPERVEPGQRWEMCGTVKYLIDDKPRCMFVGANPNAPSCDELLTSSYWHYLGTDKA